MVGKGKIDRGSISSLEGASQGPGFNPLGQGHICWGKTRECRVCGERFVGIITWARLAWFSPNKSFPPTNPPRSLSSYYHHLPCFPRAYSMPRLEIGNLVAHKKTAKSEVAVAPGKSGVLSSRAKKEKAEKQNEAKKELDRLFALSTTGEDLNSTSEEGSGECEGRGHAQGQA